MAYDNLCKYLAETYAANFVRWLLDINPTNVRVLKTEIIPEPIRSDALILLRTDNQILHLEFQTLPYSEPPLPYRMLKYLLPLAPLTRSNNPSDLLEQGLQRGEAIALLCILTRRFGEIPLELAEKVRSLPIPQLEALIDAQIDFSILKVRRQRRREEVI